MSADTTALVAFNWTATGMLTAAELVREDMKIRADMGTFDGDHDIQMSDGIWLKFCAAIDAARKAAP